MFIVYSPRQTEQKVIIPQSANALSKAVEVHISSSKTTTRTSHLITNRTAIKRITVRT